MDRNLNILQWNMQAYNSNMGDLYKLLEKHQIDIALLSETRLKPGQNTIIKNYNFIRQDRIGRQGGGVAIVCHQTIPFIKVQESEEWSDVESVGITIFPSTTPISIFSIYAPPDIKVKNNSFTALIPTTVQGNKLIIGGDFNSHNHLWGSQRSDGMRSEKIIEFADTLNLFLLNDGSSTRKQSTKALPSCLDLTFVSPTFSLISDWKVLDNSHGSDHYPVVIKILPQVPEQPQNSQNMDQDSGTNLLMRKWRIKTADWDKFKNKLEDCDITEEINQTSDTEKIFDTIYQTISTAADESMKPIKKYQGKRKNNRFKPVWWDEECEAQIDIRDMANDVFNETPSDANLTKLNNIIALTKKELKKVKKEKWKKYTESIPGENATLSDVWQTTKGYRTNAQNPNRIKFKDPNPTWVEPFLNKYTTGPKELPEVKETRSMESPNLIPLEKDISVSEVEFCIRNRKKSTAPGSDGHPYIIFKNLPNNMIYNLTILYNKILETGKIPSPWKKVVLIPILKEGKDPTSENSYRPISKLQCYLKLFENIIKNRIEWYVEKEKLLPENQMGFRKGRSTTDPAAILTCDIQTALAQENVVASAFLDLEAAYDSVDLEILSQQLLEMNIPFSIVRCICHILKDRETYVEYQNKIYGPMICNKGLPQGSSLSPLLFNIYTLGIHKLNSNKGQIIQFADDFMIYCIATTFTIAQQNLQELVNAFVDWSKTLGFKLSANKCQYVIFTRRQIDFLEPEKIPWQLTIGNTILKPEPWVRYLGFYLDKTLTWKTHILDLTRKVEKGINLIRALCGVWWGSSPRALLALYKGLIRSRMDYGSVLYHSASNTLLEKIDKLQRKALRICLGAMTSTRNEFVLAEAGELPLDLRRKILAEKLKVKAYARRDNPLNDKINNLHNERENKFWNHKNKPLFMETAEHTEELERFGILPYFMLDHPVSQTEIAKAIDVITFKNITTHDNEVLLKYEFAEIINEKWNGFEYIYVDGSKQHEKTGAAYYHSNTKSFKIIKFRYDTTIFSAELTAIYEAIKFASNQLVSKNILILSDSLSSLLKLSHLDLEANCNFLLIKIIEAFNETGKQGKNIQFVWVPAHKGIPGNEQADKLAKQGLEQGLPTTYLQPYTELIPRIKKSALAEWTERYTRDTQESDNPYKVINTKIGKKPWFQGVSDSRAFVATITRLRVGHNCSPAHLSRIKVIDSDMCTCGLARGDANHIIFECENSKTGRNQLIKEVTEVLKHAPDSLEDLLRSANIEVYKLLYSYLKLNELQF